MILNLRALFPSSFSVKLLHRIFRALHCTHDFFREVKKCCSRFCHFLRVFGFCLHSTSVSEVVLCHIETMQNKSFEFSRAFFIQFFREIVTLYHLRALSIQFFREIVAL